jgi:hypothetical protein
MKFDFNTRYNTIALYAIIVFAVCLLMIMVAFRIEIFTSAFSKIISVSSPIIWGFVIAYLLNLFSEFLQSFHGIFFILPSRLFARKFFFQLSKFLLKNGKSVLRKMVVLFFQCCFLNFHLHHTSGKFIQLRRH